MRARCWILVAALLTGGLTAVASAQQGVRWQPNLETARRVAAQTNRLVLVHFWGEPCPPCKRMQEEVLSRDDVASALAANYVPVQINVRHYPKTAREFGVTNIPTDVVITPESDVLERSVGAFPPAQYVERLSRIASSARRQPSPAYAQAPSGPAVGESYGGGAGRGETSAPGEPYQRPPVRQSRPTPEEYAAGGPNGYSSPPWGPGYGSSGPTQPSSPLGASGREDPWVAGAARQPLASSFGGETAISYQGPGGPPLQGPAPQSPPPQGFAQSPSQPPTGRSPAARGSPSPDNPWGPRQPSPTPGQASGAAQRRADPPPAGMDGYCPVQLVENGRWVRGTHDAGVIHRDWLYLCAGPEERRRFLADPDRYAPVLAGHDVVLAIDQNQLVPGLRKYGVFYDTDKRVYLFASQASRDRFWQAPERYAATVQQAMAATARRGAPPDRPYGPAVGFTPEGRY